jgi:hypothetical protein
MEWNASDVALLTALWTKGHSAGQVADRLGHSRNAVRQANSFGPEAQSQAANSKPQDKAGAEAEATANFQSWSGYIPTRSAENFLNPNRLRM